MRDYVDIGPSPAEEPCAQLGVPGYEKKAREECTRFIDLIRRTLGEEPGSAHLAIKGSSHDFGYYYSVVCYFDDRDEAAAGYAYRCEDEAPTEWGEDDPDKAPPTRYHGLRQLFGDGR